MEKSGQWSLLDNDAEIVLGIEYSLYQATTRTMAFA
jgi:hypothetical protein